MKRLFIFIFLLVAVIGCKADNGTSQYEVLNDSIVSLMQFGTMRNDTALLEKALSLSETLLKMSNTKFEKQLCYRNRAMILNYIGRYEEAMQNTEEYMLCLPEDNPERLIYMGIKSKKAKKANEADAYFTRAIEVCEQFKNEKYLGTVFTYRFQAIYLRDGEEKAKAYLHGELRKHPKDDILLYYRDNFKNIISEYDAAINRLMNIA